MHFYTSAHIHRGKLLLRGYKDGERFESSDFFKPHYYVASKTPTDFKNIDGEFVKRIDFRGTKEAREFLDKYEDVSNFKIYGLLGNLNMYAHLNEAFPGEIHYDPKLIRVINIDIETMSDQGFPDIATANMEIIAITVSFRGKKIVYGMGEFVNKNPDTTKYIQCEDEEMLLRKFILLWEKIDPDVVTGWNIEGFDIPYLYNRITRICGKEHADRLSPHKVVQSREVKSGNFINDTYEIYGVNQLDYMALYKKFSFKNQESFSLDNISFVELKEKKLNYAEYESLHGLYKNDYQKFIEYNIKDVELVDRLDAKLGFLDQVFAIAYSSKVMYIDTLATVRIWDVIIHNYLIDRNVVISPNEQKQKLRPNAGGFVKQPEPGMYHWITSFDLNSLYPSLIQQYNISPETYIDSIAQFEKYCDGVYDYDNDRFITVPEPEKCVDMLFDGYLDNEKLETLKKQDMVFSASGAIFDKSRRGFIPEIMSNMYNDRVLFKNKMIAAKKELELVKAEMEKRGIE